MTNYEIAHSFNDLATMSASLNVAIHSELRFLSKDKIKLYYQSPNAREYFEYFNKLATVIECDTVTNPFSTGGDWYSYYGEKIHAADSPTKNILLMDCDVLVVHNPEPIWDLDFEVAVSPQTPFMTEMVKTEKWISGWNNLFKSFNRTPRNHFELGVTFFKDGVLQEIKDDYLELMKHNLPINHNFYDKEQLAFCLALHDRNVKYLTHDEIGDFRYRTLPFYEKIYQWALEPNPIIWHIGIKGLGVTNFD